MKETILIWIVALACLTVSAQNLKPQKDKETKKYGYINGDGEWIVSPTYDDADKINDGYGVIYSSKKRGLIDATGKVILEPRFDDIDRFKDGFAQVELNDKKGLITPDGKVLLEPRFDKIDKFSDGVAEVKDNGKYGLISNSGVVLFEPLFDRISSFDKEGNADIESSGKWGLINRSGTTLFEAQFPERLRFENNGLAIAKRDGLFGIVKKKGEVAFEFKAEAISYEQGIYVIGITDEWRLYSENMKPVSGKYEEMAGFFGFGSSKRFIRDNKVAVKKEGKWGFISAEGNEVIKPAYDAIDSDGFKCSFCAVKIGDKWGYIRADGSWFREPEFDNAEAFTGIGNVAAANVVKDGKQFRLKNDGTLTDLTPAPAPVVENKSTASTVAATAPKTPVSSSSDNQSLPGVASKSTPAAAPAVDESAWVNG
ncbi:MAG: hypothetical protein CVU06_10580, partial [Bacteroidetes bacterium HGW-Bacteroidetes-22]